MFTNLVETDQVYGHRNDVPGFHGALQAIDAEVGEWLAAAGPGARPAGASPPTTAATRRRPGTDHTREHVPLLARFDGHGGRRHDGPFADVGASVLRWLTGRDAPLPGHAVSSERTKFCVGRGETGRSRELAHCGFTGRHHSLDGAGRRGGPSSPAAAAPRARRARPRRRATAAQPPSPSRRRRSAAERHRAARHAARRSRAARSSRATRRASCNTSTGAQATQGQARDRARQGAAARRRASSTRRRHRGRRATAATLRVDMSYSFDGIDTVYVKTSRMTAQKTPKGWRVVRRPAVRGRARAVGVHDLQGPHEHALPRARARRA